MTFYPWASFLDIPDWAHRAHLLTRESIILYGESIPVWYLVQRVTRQHDGTMLLLVPHDRHVTMMNKDALVLAVEGGVTLRASYHDFVSRLMRYHVSWGMYVGFAYYACLFWHDQNINCYCFLLLGGCGGSYLFRIGSENLVHWRFWARWGDDWMFPQRPSSTLFMPRQPMWAQ